MPGRSEDAVLTIRGLRKHFGGQVALAGVDLDLNAGEIHALLGENGAGKSTVIKILAGVVSQDDGAITVLGQPLGHHSPGSDEHNAIAFVHQDLGLIESMSVAENVALVTGFAYRHRMVSMRQTRREVADLLTRYQIDVSVDAPVASLDQDEKVMVAVARALSLNARVVVLDEVSASLPAPLMARLARSLQQSRDAGAAYLYVTHRLAEVFDLADRVTVLRDGRVRATANVADVSHDQVVGWIVGDVTNHGAVRPRRELSDDPDFIGVDLTADGLAEPLSISIARGEVVGVCGLTGSGTRTVARLVSGAQRPDSGQATLGGERLPLGRRAGMCRAGVAYVPGDRQYAGTAQDMSIRENMYLRRGRFPGGVDDYVYLPQSERSLAEKWADSVGLAPRGGTDKPLVQLSGGNQQKVVLARALRTRPRLLVLEDPTAGVDVGARAELHRLIQKAATSGTSVLLCSTDFEEVAAQADRVLVMNAGSVTAELTYEEISLDRLTTLSYREKTNPNSGPVEAPSPTTSISVHSGH